MIEIVLQTNLQVRCRPAAIHPAEHELETFRRGTLPRREVAPIVRHLLTGCTRCLTVTHRLWELGAGR